MAVHQRLILREVELNAIHPARLQLVQIGERRRGTAQRVSHQRGHHFHRQGRDVEIGSQGRTAGRGLHGHASHSCAAGVDVDRAGSRIELHARAAAGIAVHGVIQTSLVGPDEQPVEDTVRANQAVQKLQLRAAHRARAAFFGAHSHQRPRESLAQVGLVGLRHARRR